MDEIYIEEKTIIKHESTENFVDGNNPSNYLNSSTNLPLATQTTQQQSATDLCLVCGDRASGRHYGAISCEGCKGFFKRSIRKQLGYQCRGQMNCEVTKHHRNRCQFCRLQKCLASGMRSDSVQHERKPILDKKAFQQQQQSQNSTDNGLNIISNTNTNNQNSIFANCNSISNQATNLLNFSTSQATSKYLNNHTKLVANDDNNQFSGNNLVGNLNIFPVGFNFSDLQQSLGKKVLLAANEPFLQLENNNVAGSNLSPELQNNHDEDSDSYNSFEGDHIMKPTTNIDDCDLEVPKVIAASPALSQIPSTVENATTKNLVQNQLGNKLLSNLYDLLTSLKTQYTENSTNNNCINNNDNNNYINNYIANNNISENNCNNNNDNDNNYCNNDNNNNNNNNSNINDNDNNNNNNDDNNKNINIDNSANDNINNTNNSNNDNNNGSNDNNANVSNNNNNNIDNSNSNNSNNDHIIDNNFNENNNVNDNNNNTDDRINNNNNNEDNINNNYDDNICNMNNNGSNNHIIIKSEIIDERQHHSAPSSPLGNCSNLFDTPILHATNIPFPLQSPQKVPNYLNTHYVCETGSRILFLSVYWLKKIPAFQTLSDDVQIKLIRYHWVKLFSIGLAQTSKSISMPVIIQTLSENILRQIEQKRKENDTNDEQKNLQDEIDRIEQFTKHTLILSNFVEILQNLNLTDDEYGYIRLLCAFNPEFLLFSITKDIKNQKQKLLKLQEYSLNCYKIYLIDNNSSEGRLEQILLNLMQLNSLQSNIIEELFFSNLIGNIQIDNMIPYILKLGAGGI